MEHISIDPIYLLGVLVGLVAWFTKLEAKGNRNSEDIADQKLVIAEMAKKHDNLENKLMTDLSEVKQALARIEGQLSK